MNEDLAMYMGITAVVLGGLLTLAGDDPGIGTWIIYSLICAVVLLVLFGAVKLVKMMWMAA
jgi:hypothetical protein